MLLSLAAGVRLQFSVGLIDGRGLGVLTIQKLAVNCLSGSI